MGGLIILLLLLIAACKTVEVLAPPSHEELAEQGFALPEISRITCEQLKQLMDKGDDFVVVGAEIKLSFDYEHIEGAINIPATPVPPLTEKMIESKLLGLPKNKLIVFYCQ